MSDRKEYIKNTIKKFIVSSYDERLEQCTFGIEIETQSDGGGDDWDIIYDNLDREDYMDVDRYYEDLSERVRNRISSDKLSELVSYTSSYRLKVPMDNIHLFKKKHRHYCWEQHTHKTVWVDLKVDWFKKYYKNIIIDRIKEIEDRAERLDIDIYDIDFKLKLCNRFKHVWGELDSMYDFDSEICDYALEESEREGLEDSDYEYSLCKIKANHPDLFSSIPDCSNNDVEIVSDESVTGNELRTMGGLKQPEFVEAIDDILDSVGNSDHWIDNDCSAHLHIKLGDIKHYYGDGKLHGAIMEYLAFNFDRLPRRVQTRLKYGGNRWIRPQFRPGKYQWVNFHDQGTIEFRLFGNLDNTDDVLVCQQIALEALAYGYQVRFGDYKRALDNKDLQEILEAA